MRDLIRDPKYQSSNAIPLVFNEDDLVIKRKGDYLFKGVVLSAFRKRSGAQRYVVENDDGIVHIFNPEQLEIDVEPQAKP